MNYSKLIKALSAVKLEMDALSCSPDTRDYHIALAVKQAVYEGSLTKRDIHTIASILSYNEYLLTDGENLVIFYGATLEEALNRAQNSNHFPRGVGIWELKSGG